MAQWNLDSLYQGFDETYKKDLEKLDQLTDNYIEFLASKVENDVAYIEGVITFDEDITKLARTLYGFASLTQSTDVANHEALTYLSKVSEILRKPTAASVKYSRYLAKLDLDQLAIKSNKIKLYLSNLKRTQKHASYLLSEAEEVLYAKLSELSSRSWSQVQQLATSNLTVHFRGKEITFSDLRNLAYDQDQMVRKEAYELEMAAFNQIDDYVALSLSNIKREVHIMHQLRGYDSVLQKTLEQSRMKQETLDAMIAAMKDFRPHFTKYLKAKAKHLGHQDGLPFYDLFAPVGKLNQRYSYDEAKDLVLKAFGSYSDKLKAFAQKAFDQNWIDVFPKKGKRGGAFCSNQPQIGESRIMLNFTGALDNVSTLAHELGHGYHGDVIKDNAPNHWNYPMPLAETASIFCETIMNKYLLETVQDKHERLSILENGLQGDTQVIIDILSRFLFEDKVFSHAMGPISKHEFNDWMKAAQKEAYQDGLDQEYLHPYMWLVKPHYYSAGLNYYNFPYAFGLLFGKGLYAQYVKNKEVFLKHYDGLLSLTTKEDVETVAASMGIDITQKAFWKESLEMIKQDIDEVIYLLLNTSSL